MNRMNFGRSSGIIVDVCREHGTWFDADELTGAIAFVAKGGLEAARKKEAEERAAQMSKRVNAALSLFDAAPNRQDRRNVDVDLWRDLLDALFRG